MTGTEQAEGFSAAERKAMKERAAEVRAASRRGRKAADDAAAVLAKIAEMPEPDRGLAEQVHAVVTEHAPDLAPKLWYGMPAYARDGKIVCFFQGAAKFESRYATLGFNDAANLDDGAMWPTAFALTKVTAEVKARIAELVRRAA
ncbi:iron chaperone [Spirilliplanes yamanashiensis]|uniref:YdhG-like domain-containing protein n=1 Tax=Spirilliplanes yamanashiensis TaxID=42233 RepID=A0A8J4DJQ8_9ACTN|nr:DUF1801 domain-containing protein [Spirilliplanes yamanashiensis]MDP9815315.1 uncharacterized protein YdhG (YjbR/CyaY superfamily) [Spirilliplanes yamanashiensis]GIJ03569.1 hypothetical protein Sya03_29210 [Spirilliplanes yamanashiensis]